MLRFPIILLWLMLLLFERIVCDNDENSTSTIIVEVELEDATNATTATLPKRAGFRPAKIPKNDDIDAPDSYDDDNVEVDEISNHLGEDEVYALPYQTDLEEMDLRVQCIAGGGNRDGVCYTRRECNRRGGKTADLCPGGTGLLICCVFELSCGDITSEPIVYLQSPSFPVPTTGSLACDYDVAIQEDICAVRIDYIRVQLARKLGGVCDIDQLFILNSVDGPTTGQCGPLTGYSTTLAVHPKQEKPVKVALLIQNEAYYFWNIRLRQLHCDELNNLREPNSCGRKKPKNDEFELNNNHKHTAMNSPPATFFAIWPDGRWRRFGTGIMHVGGVDMDAETRTSSRDHVWWSFPEPIFNTFYYGSTKRDLMNSINANTIANINRRIVGGTDAEINEFPWQVAIFLEELFFCGGALINDQFIVTAAHCFMTRDTPIHNLVVLLGDHDLTSVNETYHIRRKVRTVMFHSHFHPFLLSNDIAMLRLAKPVAFSRGVRPVCLPQSGESYTGLRGTVVGWGITSFPMGEPSPILQKLEVETISNFQCSRLIEEPVGLGMICATPTSLQGTCFGDSGGPLTIENEFGADILIGIVSFGVTGCAVMPAFPDLYTRVSEYIKWIQVNAIL